MSAVYVCSINSHFLHSFTRRNMDTLWQQHMDEPFGQVHKPLERWTQPQVSSPACLTAGQQGGHSHQHPGGWESSWQLSAAISRQALQCNVSHTLLLCQENRIRSWAHIWKSFTKNKKVWTYSAILPHLPEHELRLKYSCLVTDC